MTFLPQNATGWSELIDGNMIYAAFSVFDATTILNGWTIAILFVVYQIILWIKTKSATLAFITGIMFISMFITATTASAVPLIAPHALKFIFLILVIEVAGILYFAFWR